MNIRERLTYVKAKMHNNRETVAGFSDRGKVSVIPIEGRKRTKTKNSKSPCSRAYQFPRARLKGAILIPFALAACIPESAIRKFAAKEPFIVQVNDDTGERFVLYFGD